MKTTGTVTCVFCIMMFLFSFASDFSVAQEISYPDSWGKQGFTIIDQTDNRIEINHSVSSFHFSKTQVNGIAMDAIKVAGSFLPNEEGYPDLPVMSSFIAIPYGATVSFKITGFRTESFSDIELAPAPRIPRQTESGPMEYNKNMNIYTRNAFYPEQPVIISGIKQVRGMDAVILAISPFRYNPVTKELIVYRDLKVKIDFKGGNGHFGENRLRNRWWEPLFNNMFINYRSLREINYNSQTIITKDDGAEYLIISPNGQEFQQWADSIRNFRTAQGILSDVVTLDDVGGNDVSLIENYINNAYNTWDIPPVAILLLGDYGSNAANSVIAPVWDGYCVSDNIYADVNGNDLPDIVVARICAQNEEQLETMVSKFINYEKYPPVDSNYYRHPITTCNFVPYGYYQFLTETVAGFYENVLGKSPNRVNVGPDTLPDLWSTAPNAFPIVEYFGPEGLGYIPATPGEVGCSWNGTTNDLVNGINNGAFMLLHRSHASEQGWLEPPFTNADINNLNNINLTFIWSADGLTGKFNYPTECLAEKFHRHKFGDNNAGALGVVAASEITYAFLNEVYSWGAWDYMWTEFLPETGPALPFHGVYPAFANAEAKYFVEQTSWPVNPNLKTLTYHVFHCFGDAFSTVYSEIPQELDVFHDGWLQSGETSFDVTANQGSLMALSVNGELIGVAEGTGEPVAIQISPQTSPGQMLVTVTKQNYYRYEDYVPVLEYTGFNESDKRNDIFVFPNPSTGKFSIKAEEYTGTVTITVFNTLMSAILQIYNKDFRKDVIAINLHNQPKGIYYIILESDSMKTIRKVIIR